MNILFGVVSLALLCGCSAGKERHEREIESISQATNSQRNCLANGFTSEPACFYSVSELVEMEVSSPIAIYSEGRISKVDTDFYLVSMDDPKIRVRIRAEQDVEVLNQAIVDPRRDHVVVFGNYEENESVRSIHAFSIRWIK